MRSLIQAGTIALLMGLPACKTATIPLDFTQAAAAGASFSALPDSDRCTASTRVSPTDPTLAEASLSCAVNVAGPVIQPGGSPTAVGGFSSGGRSNHVVGSGFVLQNGWTVSSVAVSTGSEAGQSAGSTVTSSPTEGSNTPTLTLRLFLDAPPEIAVGSGVAPSTVGSTVRIFIKGPRKRSPYVAGQ